METIQPLLMALLVVATVMCGVAVWALIEAGRTARSARAFSDDTRERLIPLLDKADVTVDAVNAELLRIDAIITQVEEASARVSHASDTISGIVSTPAEIVNDVASRVRRAWKDRHRSEDRGAEGQPQQGEDAEAEQSDAHARDGEPISVERGEGEPFGGTTDTEDAVGGEAVPVGEASDKSPIVSEKPA